MTYWPGNSQQPLRIFAALSNGRLIAFNAKTGKLVPGFGSEGVLDLRTDVTAKFPDAPYHMSSPGTIFRNLLITGAQGKEDDPDGPAMGVRAWDVATGGRLDLPHNSSCGRSGI